MRIPGQAATTGRQWSPQQKAIFEAFRSETSGHVLVRARAGCAKTTTSLEGVKLAPERKILIAAFNKLIADEAKIKLGVVEHIESRTLHALGMGYIKSAWGNVRVDSKRGWELVNDYTCDQPIKTALNATHTKVRELNPWADTREDIEKLAVLYDLLPSDELWGKGWDEARFYDAVLEILQAATEETDVIDFADMIYLPLRCGMVYPKYGLTVVDEAQDMTYPQLEIAKRATQKDGRIIVVGDDRQAIYGFRGADSGALDRLKQQLGAIELGLKTTYRCGRSIVERAREYVPDFEAAPTVGEGVVRQCLPSEMIANAVPGDFVLSRVNAPLMGVALGLIRRGVRARIRGREIGKGLIEIVKKLRIGQLSELGEELERWKTKEIAKLSKRDKQLVRVKMAQLIDNVDTLNTLAESAEVQTVEDLVRRLGQLFDDETGAASVMCSTVHKAKGLEADRVWVLEDTLKRGGLEEENIRYVAYTRARNELVLVTMNSVEKEVADAETDLRCSGESIGNGD